MTNVSQIALCCVAGLLAMASLTSCDVDVFGMERKKILPGYELEYFPDGKSYYLNFTGAHAKPNALEAVILEIGWSDQLILARVFKQYRGDKDGVYAIDRATARIDGPIHEASLASDERYRHIRLQKPEVIFPRSH